MEAHRRDARVVCDPAHRPEVANLVLLAALCPRRDPHQVGAEIAAAGSAALKRLVTEAVNERFRAIRGRRAELVRDRGYPRDVLRAGNERAWEIAERTLAEVQRLMHTPARLDAPPQAHCAPRSSRRATLTT